jgi:ABC-type nickel/cobalt efflux system permease component RcnA
MTGWLAILALALPLAAGAHPLGNFSLNRYAAVRVEKGALAIRYVVDMAEIPAFQEITAADADRSGDLETEERAAYVARLGPELGRGLAVTAAGTPLPLGVGAGSLEVAPGAGGLPTLRLEFTYTAALPGEPGMIEVRDQNFAGRPGWREMIADAGADLALAASTVPRTDRSRALRAYPADELASPPQVSTARFRITAGAAAPEPAPTASPAVAGRPRDRLIALIVTREPLGLGLILTSLLVAASLGALHGLGPGHGKTIVGAYLVGARGTARHALFLGLVVTVTHTLGVYLLGLVTLGASQWIVPERLFPWLGMFSGLLVITIGASLAISRLVVLDAGNHHHHHHDHDHGPHTHTHADLAAGDAGLTWKNLFALGVSGGLLPCPSALVVMLAAIALGRIVFGLGLIVAFSAGLAVVLSAIGLVFVYARGWFDRLPVDGRFARYLPVASAVVISVAGILIVAQALAEMGVLGAFT